MLYPCMASEEHDLSHPSIQNMKSKCLNKFISLHWIQKELKVRLGLDVCLADLCGTSHPHTGERPARPQQPPTESRAGPGHGAKEPVEMVVPWPDQTAWLHLQKYLGDCPIHTISLQETPSFRVLSWLGGLQEQRVLIPLPCAWFKLTEAKLESMQLNAHDFTSLRSTSGLLYKSIKI